MNQASVVEPVEIEPPTETSAEAQFDEILYHITHDVRATLRALKSLPGWLREDLTGSGMTPSTSVLEILQMIESQASLADRILLDLRTFSRIGRLQDAPSAVPLDDALSDAAGRIALPASFQLTSSLEVPAMTAPRNEIRELLTAALSNCVKHHDQSSGTIDVSTRLSNGMIILRIDDDGPGIPQRFREKVFEMMTTLRSRDDCPGSGLGLAIARKIATTLHGTVCATDPPGGRGTRIEFHLPGELAAMPTAT